MIFLEWVKALSPYMIAIVPSIFLFLKSIKKNATDDFSLLIDSYKDIRDDARKELDDAKVELKKAREERDIIFAKERDCQTKLAQLNTDMLIMKSRILELESIVARYHGK